jgi:hypothetical protein
MYAVSATKEGCNTESSELFTVPPPKTGLELTLTCSSPPSLSPTHVGVSSSTTGSSYGEPVTITAAVSGGSGPTGTVTFFEGSKSIGEGVLASGSASMTLSTLTPGTHSITASYSGDGANQSSTSTAITVTVVTSGPAPAIKKLSPKKGPATGGTLVRITGTNFTGVKAVKFGSTAARKFEEKSATSIAAESPPGTGTVNVTVTTPNGESATTKKDHFEYKKAKKGALAG